MECNRDEAIHAKIIAEKKLEDRDFAGAKKFVLKAQNLYPPLEGLSQMLSTLDVYIAAENKVRGEVDWYGVLGVTPSADDETITKQYRKLALMLHPDKHKSVGADGAFKFLSEAWSLLSDKAKRLAYNQRRSSKGFQHKVQNQTGGPSAAPSANGFNNFTNRVPSKPKTQKSTVPTPSFQRTDTFWTVCNQCKIHYEYLKVYLNHTLLCPNCHQVFLAAEMAPPVNISNSSNSSSQRPHQNLSNHAPSSNPGRNTASVQNIRQGASVGLGPNSSKHTNSPWGAYSNVAGTGKTEPSIAAKAANVVQQANERLKRGYEESQDSVRKGDAPFKKRALDGDDHNYGGKVPFKMSVGNGEAGTRSISGLRGFSFIIRPNSTRELTPLETRNMLMQKARIEISKKLSEWKSEAVYRTAEKNKVEQRKEEKLKNTMKCGAQLNGIHESSTTKRAGEGKHLSSSSADGKNKDPVAMSMNVPDPDFHDFDLDRTERSFGENQIWAAYDDDDGMPRFYAFIHKIISRKPFKMRISWLNSKTNSEFGPMEWVGSGFYKTCGEFRMGKFQINKSLNSFSHKVKWTKGTRGILHIVPQKGDTWALYRNWSLDWNERTPDEVIHKYDMVEVLDDYNEEHGVSVTPLIKVSVFRTVFHTQLEHDKVMRIPKEEMFRFSHQVPNYMLTGQESQNAPKGCQELDPAATPLELLQVTAQVDEVPVMEKDGYVQIEVLQNVPGIRVNETAEGAFENNEGTKEGAPILSGY